METFKNKTLTLSLFQSQAFIDSRFFKLFNLCEKLIFFNRQTGNLN